ncbi:MAG: cytochrome c [Gammaproteobacteria bacterium]|nr:cytochrome c [Gammaproteobacteria bacterium]
MSRLRALLMTAAIPAVMSAATQADGPSRGEVLASTCHACHGPEGRGSPPLPPLRGRSDLRTQLLAWKSSAEASGDAHLMIRFARGLSEADIDALAAYFAAKDAP